MNEPIAFLRFSIRQFMNQEEAISDQVNHIYASSNDFDKETYSKFKPRLLIETMECMERQFINFQLIPLIRSILLLKITPDVLEDAFRLALIKKQPVLLEEFCALDAYKLAVIAQMVSENDRYAVERQAELQEAVMVNAFDRIIQSRDEELMRKRIKSLDANQLRRIRFRRDLPSKGSFFEQQRNLSFVTTEIIREAELLRAQQWLNGVDEFAYKFPILEHIEQLIERQIEQSNYQQVMYQMQPFLEEMIIKRRPYSENLEVFYDLGEEFGFQTSFCEICKYLREYTECMSNGEIFNENNIIKGRGGEWEISRDLESEFTTEMDKIEQLGSKTVIELLRDQDLLIAHWQAIEELEKLRDKGIFGCIE